MDEQPRRIECKHCLHTLRLDDDGSYRHSGPRGASCECACQGLALEHIKQWRALDQPKTSAPRNSSPPAGVEPPKSSEAPPPVSPPAPPDVAPAVGVPAPTQAATISPVAAPAEEPATPELELPDGRLFSNSEFQTWKRCQRKWWLAYYRRLRPLHEGAVGPRSIGIRVHLALAALYAGRADPLDVIRTSVAEDLATNPDLEIGLLKDEQMALAMVEGYLQWVQETGADEGLKFLADEATLIAPMSLPDTYFIGRLDARFEREMDHARLFMDHKTVASLTEPVRTLPMNEQMLGYMLLERLDAKFNAPDGSEGEYVAGALYNMLRRVLRTERAKPPFYDRVEVHHSDIELRNYYQRIHGTIRQIMQAQTELDAGTVHHYVVPPRPYASCTWSCDFFVVCPLFDDGSDAEGLLAAYYVEDNPLRRYIEQKKELADA